MEYMLFRVFKPQESGLCILMVSKWIYGVSFYFLCYRPDYRKQIQIRFSLLETSCQQDDNFPSSICVKVTVL